MNKKWFIYIVGLLILIIVFAFAGYLYDYLLSKRLQDKIDLSTPFMNSEERKEKKFNEDAKVLIQALGTTTVTKEESNTLMNALRGEDSKNSPTLDAKSLQSALNGQDTEAEAKKRADSLRALNGQ